MAVWAKCLVGRRVWPNGKESFEDMKSYIRGHHCGVGGRALRFSLFSILFTLPLKTFKQS